VSKAGRGKRERGMIPKEGIRRAPPEAPAPEVGQPPVRTGPGRNGPGWVPVRVGSL